MYRLLNASEHQPWRKALAGFERVDVCHLPEYHEAYRLRFTDAKALMWIYEADGEKLCYPFLLGRVILSGLDGEVITTEFNDICGIYGYSGPLSTTDSQAFLGEAWQSFDLWTTELNVISEFIRFSTYVNNKNWAHPDTLVEYNRPVSLAILPDDSDSFLGQLSSKTRNMIRKAQKSMLEVREVDFKSVLMEFRNLYQETMGRNQASDFFMYDDAYYDLLLNLPEEELVLFAVYQDDKMVAAAMGLVHRDMAFYHLGASTTAASKMGAGNLVLFEMAKGLVERGINYFCIGGGRSTAQDDPLYKFKKSNGTSVGEFYIGKRVIQSDSYESVVKNWEAINHSKINSDNLQFYR